MTTESIRIAGASVSLERTGFSPSLAGAEDGQAKGEGSVFLWKRSVITLLGRFIARVYCILVASSL